MPTGSETGHKRTPTHLGDAWQSKIEYEVAKIGKRVISQLPYSLLWSLTSIYLSNIIDIVGSFVRQISAEEMTKIGQLFYVKLIGIKT